MYTFFTLVQDRLSIFNYKNVMDWKQRRQYGSFTDLFKRKDRVEVKN